MSFTAQSDSCKAREEDDQHTEIKVTLAATSSVDLAQQTGCSVYNALTQYAIWQYVDMGPNLACVYIKVGMSRVLIRYFL